jgi:D-galactose 1-dehydrogenase
MTTHRIGIIGLGKIAQAEHVPAIRGNRAFQLVAASSSQAAPLEGIPRLFTDYREMLRMRDLDAVAICTPPQPRHAIAAEALLAGKHVLLEKPPTATVSELLDLGRTAQRTGRIVFTTWHAQHNAAVDAAKAALEDCRVSRMEVVWKEDVRHWHPGQQWIWQPGGFGVFDPGVNALSILTRILPHPIFLRRADLRFPSNADAPIAASLEFSAFGRDESLRAEFDWRHIGPEVWDIELETADGRSFALRHGGSRLEIDGRLELDQPHAEYPRIYGRFDKLLREGRSEIEEAPFQLVADAFLLGRRIPVAPFEDE